MTSVERHLEVMETKRMGAYTELQAGRLPNFADLIFKAAEQAIEALLVLEVIGEKHPRPRSENTSLKNIPISRRNMTCSMQSTKNWVPAREGWREGQKGKGSS